MTYLLDINMLFVLHHPNHTSYSLVSRWFLGNAGKAFATCPITQSGLMRLLIRGVGRLDTFDSREARNALHRLTQKPGHVFWPDTPSWLDCTESLSARLQGHRQTTDAYLLGLAIHNRGKLATTDRGIRHLAGPEFSQRVELIA
jgi:uncharacterized protein